MVLVDQINEIIEPLLENGKFYVVDLKVTLGRRGQQIVLLLDSDEGIGIDECAKISRKIAFEIEERGLIEDAFVLEVSSPGVETPLTTERQFIKNINRTIKFLLIDNKTITGLLLDLKEQVLTIQEEVLRGKLKVQKKELTQLNLAQVKTGIVQVSFKDINE